MRSFCICFSPLLILLVRKAGMRLPLMNCEIGVPSNWNFVITIVFAFLVLHIISPALSQAADRNSAFQPTTTAEERAQVEDLRRKAEEGNVQAQNEISKVY